jgi:hypothetical protein
MLKIILKKILTYLETEPKKMQWHFENGALVCVSHGVTYKIVEHTWRNKFDTRGFDVSAFRKGEETPFRTDLFNYFDEAISTLDYLVFLTEKNTLDCFKEDELEQVNNLLAIGDAS